MTIIVLGQSMSLKARSDSLDLGPIELHTYDCKIEVQRLDRGAAIR